ncbi:MAG: GNAT family N-acetyltransferase [Pseudomonadota bacterium]
MRLREARPDESAAISALALRSKGYWPYSAEFLEACRDELTYPPQKIASDPYLFTLAETGDDSRLAGMLLVHLESPGQVGLDALFVEPECIGQGVGRALWQRAVEQATVHGAQRIEIHADPYAEPFYAAMGAVRVGEVPSGSVPGRVLPLMHFALRYP